MQNGAKVRVFNLRKVASEVHCANVDCTLDAYPEGFDFGGFLLPDLTTPLEVVTVEKKLIGANVKLD